MHLDTTEDYNKWLGTRLGEIMDVQKKNQSDMELHTGISRRTIKRIINEGREIKRDEIDLICDFLNITIERFLCKDNTSVIEKIENNMKQHKLNEAFSHAMDYSLNCIGSTERADVELYLGEILLGLKRMDDAFSHLSKGYEISKKTESKYHIKKSHKLLLDYYFYNGKFEEMEIFISKVLKEPTCSILDDYQLGKLYHFLAMSNFYQNNVQASVDNFATAIKRYSIVKNLDTNLDIARAKTSMAEVEYQRGNFAKSIELLEWSLDVQKKDNVYNRMSTAKDLVRNLLAIDRVKEAAELALSCLSEIDEKRIDVPTLKSRFAFVIAYVNSDIRMALEILRSYNEEDEFKVYIADFIFKSFFKGGDVEKEVLSECYDLLSKVKLIKEFVRGAW